VRTERQPGRRTPSGSSAARSRRTWCAGRSTGLACCSNTVRGCAAGAESLRHAHQVCEAHGLLPWAERARQELRATGEGRETLRDGARAPLSPQELQIARLAAEGLSNREIGQRLYLSHRTIGSHLYRIFPKLGISSRAQLGSALADGSFSSGG
jgi:DNA-binding NarL/FixJ family response regulator